MNICDPDQPDVYWPGRLAAVAGDWRLILDRRREADEAYWRALRDTGQSAATHIGQVMRLDGSLFDVEDAVPVLDAVRLALRVALGRTVSLLLPVGWWGARPTWARWRSERLDSVRTSARFLDQHKGYWQLRELIERFVAYCTTDHRLDVMGHALGYYLSSTRDAECAQRLGSTISGLLLLAHHLFVEERQDFSKTSWGKKGADGQIRHMLVDARVPTGVPAHFAELQKVANGLIDPDTGQPRDALGTVIKMRNQATHPDTGTPSLWDAFQWWEAETWATDALLLAILRVVGYTGEYRSALATNVWTGVTDTVPWAAIKP
jgi:hypothetical protein